MVKGGAVTKCLYVIFCVRVTVCFSKLQRFTYVIRCMFQHSRTFIIWAYQLLLSHCFAIKFMLAKLDELNFFLCVLLTVHLGIILVNDQLDAQLFYFYMFISILYMFQATSCLSSGESIVSIPLLLYVTHCKWPSSMQAFPTRILDGHLNTVTYTRSCIDTIDSPDDEHEVARNM
jgi:hypothetical protein